MAFSSSSRTSTTRSVTKLGRHGAVADRPDADSLVILDLGEGGPNSRGKGRGLEHSRVVAGTRDDEEVLGAAPEPGGQVVELVQRAEHVLVLVVALQLVDEDELTVHEVLRALRHIGEHQTDIPPHHHLPFHQQSRGDLHAVERLGQLANLVAGGHVDCGKSRRLRIVGVVSTSVTRASSRSARSATAAAAWVSR